MPTLKLEIFEGSPWAITSGQLRRLPKSWDERLVGYHFACPQCQAAWLVVHDYRDFEIHEDAATKEVSFSDPVICYRCALPVKVRQSVAYFEENNVRRSAG